MRRPILLVGGKADGERLTVLHGDSIIMAGENSGHREVYRIVTLRGSTRSYEVGVIAKHASDGDWLIERLLNGYARTGE